MKSIIRKSAYAGVLFLVFSGVISCEKDFTDIGTNVVANTKFSTEEIILDVEVTERDIDAVRGDNISIGTIGEYLLGVYKHKDYEKIEASIVSQIVKPTTINVSEGETDTTTVTSVFDNAFLKIPYTATNIGKNSDGTPKFKLDSVLGDVTKNLSVKIYRNNTYLNILNPQDPSKGNVFSSDFVYDKGELLNDDANFSFVPNVNDTIYDYTRTLKSGQTFKDTLKLSNANPFLVIPLKKSLMKSLFFDKLTSDDFASQDALNNFFRGLIIEASATESFLLPLSLRGNLNPSIEINYTNTVERKSNGTVKDTIKKTASFLLGGVANRFYNMTKETNSTNADQVIIQGAAGKYGDVKILQGNQLSNLRANNWLINDATLTFYIDQDRDTTNVPEKLFLYKEETSSQIKDAHKDGQTGFQVFSGDLKKENNKKDHYSFKITDYISDVLGGAKTKNYNLTLKVYNSTDSPFASNRLDTIVNSYNWNPRAVTIFNGAKTGVRKAQLKISYSKKN